MELAFAPHAHKVLRRSTEKFDTAARCPRRERIAPRMGLGDLWQNLQKGLVRTPGSKKGDLLDCVFCGASGRMKCDACGGSGSDRIGRCLMCDGKGKLKCSVCQGFGKVDSIRRGGTDSKGEFTKRALKKRQAASAGRSVTDTADVEAATFTCESAPVKCACYESTVARPPLYYNGEGPLVDKVRAGKTYALCACGQSTMFPYCGGAHSAYNEQTGCSFEPYEVTYEEETVASFCRCGHSKTRPFCDGTHNRLQEVSS